MKAPPFSLFLSVFMQEPFISISCALVHFPFQPPSPFHGFLHSPPSLAHSTIMMAISPSERISGNSLAFLSAAGAAADATNTGLFFFFSPSFYPSTSSFQRYYTYILYVYINVDITELFNDYIQLRSFFFYSSTLVFNFFFFFFIYLFFDAKCWLISFVLFPLCCILYYIYDVCVCVCC